jgi:hypothetical protein
VCCQTSALWQRNSLYLGINLLSDFAPDFAGVARKQCQETLPKRSRLLSTVMHEILSRDEGTPQMSKQRAHLCAAVDHVNLVQRDDVHHLPAPLQLPVWALHKARRWTCRGKISA